jgi:hypothetical protein
MPCVLDALLYSQQEPDGTWYAYAAVSGLRSDLGKGATQEEAERKAIHNLTVANNGYISQVLSGKVVLD